MEGVGGKRTLHVIVFIRTRMMKSFRMVKSYLLTLRNVIEYDKDITEESKDIMIINHPKKMDEIIKDMKVPKMKYSKVLAG